MTSRWDRVGRYFPLPLVSVAVLLVILIFVTPNLASPAGTLSTQAELLVDRVVGSNFTNFYVRAIGTVRYDVISVSLASNAVWPPVLPPTPPLRFSNTTSQNNSLGVGVSSKLNPVAVNVTAVYGTSSGTCVEYVGTFVFYAVTSTQTLEYVDLSPSSTGGTQSAAISSLPIPLLLDSVPYGAC